MDNIFYLDSDLTQKTAQPTTADLPSEYFELLEYDLAVLKDDYGLTIYEIEWTSEGVTTDLDDAKTTKDDSDIEATVTACNSLCMQYQTGDTDPRIDPNFYSTVVVGYGLLKSMGLKTEEDCPNCQAVTDWINTLWITVWESIKTKIRASENYSTDFATLMVEAGSTANPPKTFDECYAELV